MIRPFCLAAVVGQFEYRPIGCALLGPKSTYSYRYWLVVGTEASITSRLDSLWEKYSREKSKLTK